MRVRLLIGADERIQYKNGVVSCAMRCHINAAGAEITFRDGAYIPAAWMTAETCKHYRSVNPISEIKNLIKQIES